MIVAAWSLARVKPLGTKVNCLDPALGVYSFAAEKVLANDVSIKYVF